MSRCHDIFDADRLYRNTRQGRILGVCAGLADFWKTERWLVRLGALAALWFLTVPALLAYFAIGLLVAKRPDWSYL